MPERPCLRDTLNVFCFRVDFYPEGCEDNGITGLRMLISVPKAKNGHPIPHISDVGSFMQLISNGRSIFLFPPISFSDWFVIRCYM